MSNDSKMTILAGAILFSLFSVFGYSQTHHADPWNPVSENWGDSVKKYEDISDWYYRFDYHNPRYVQTLRLKTYYDSLAERKRIEGKYKVRLK